MNNGNLFLVILTVVFISPHTFAQKVLYEYDGWLINGGKFSAIARFQTRAAEVLTECNIAHSLKSDGKFGNGTKQAIAALARCPMIAQQLPADSKAFDGAITEDLWRILGPQGDIPDADARARSVKLTFENTDYDKMQWNYCQNKPLYDPDRGVKRCRSNDKRSFITWGPNGATAGHGREVQMIVQRFLNENDAQRLVQFNQTFGDESAAVLRMLEMQKSDSVNTNGPLETYLCSVWLDPQRRKSWQQGFQKFGSIEEVRGAYSTVYQSTSFDAGKIKRFYEVWTDPQFDLPVSEIDHGFFVDRSAHMSISKDDMIDALKKLKKSYAENWPIAAAMVRRHIALNVTPSNQQKDRLGRDVAFYVDGIGLSELSEKEQSYWKLRGAVRASNVGLSDKREMPPFVAGEAISFPMPSGQLRADESCPAAVLNPVS